MKKYLPLICFIFCSIFLLPWISFAGPPTPKGVSNTAYDATSWNGVKHKAPSQDTVRDKIETMIVLEADVILEAYLKAVDSATDEDFLSYESTTGDFEWHSADEIAGKFGADVLKHSMIDWSDIGNLGENGLPNDFALAADADAGDFNIHSFDGLYGVDDQIWMDMGTNGTLAMGADGYIKMAVPEFRFEVDAAAYLKIVTANGGITTISQVSDGTDGITIGDNADNIIISADNWDVDTSGNASFGGTVSAAPSTTPGWTGYDSDQSDDDIIKFYGDAADVNDSRFYFQVEQGNALVTYFELDGVDEEIQGLKPLNMGTNNIITTGTITGRNSIGTDITGNTAHDTTELHGVMYKATAAATVILDAAADAGFGACACYRIRDAAEKLVLDLDNAEKFNLAGTALAAGTAIEATGVGEYCTVCATTDADGSGTDGYDVYGETSGWASE